MVLFSPLLLLLITTSFIPTIKSLNILQVNAAHPNKPLYDSMDFRYNRGSKLIANILFSFCPQFSPAVNKALEEKKLTGNRRNELTRDLCSSIRVHTMYPTKVEREHGAFLLIKKNFLFLEMPLAVEL